jgi:hypothetical protein
MMNPIIAELVEQNRDTVATYVVQSPDKLSDELIDKLYHEEFAKLIIYECMWFLKDKKHHGKIRTRKAAGEALFKHFVLSNSN